LLAAGITLAGTAIMGMPAPVHAQSGTWTKVTTNPFGSNGFTELLTDGSVLVQYGDWHDFAKLTPDANGNYSTGTWTNLAPSHIGRLYAPSTVLRDGRFFIAGGEVISDSDPQIHNSMEIYDPVTNIWTQGPNGIFDDIGDTGFQRLADGRVLVSYRFGSQCQIYDPISNAWTQVASRPNGNGDEASFTLLPDGTVFDDITNPGAKYIPSSNTWISVATAPVTLTDPSNDEVGPELPLYNGKIFCEGYNALAFYVPGSTQSSAGSWTSGPALPAGQYGGDVVACIEPNGKVLMETGAGAYTTTTFYEYDPSTNTVNTITQPPVTPDRSDLIRMLPLPNGQILVTGIYVGSSDSYVYTPVGGPQTSWRPTISSIVRNSDGTYTLTGTQLNGLSTGAAYGDDCGMDSNYPLVQLVSGSNVYYARTFNHSTMGVATGTASVSTHFSLPSNLPNATYAVHVVANGIASTTSYNLTINRLPAPSSLTATGGPSIGLSWPAVSGATSYNIYRGSVSNGEGLTAYATSSTNSYADSGVTYGSVYYYKVAAVNSNGPSAQSSEATATAAIACAPAWSSTAVYVAGNQASVNGVNYQANYWTQGQNPATNNGGAGSGQPWTSLTSCGAPVCSTTPSAPANLSASNTTSTSTALTWNAVTAPANCSISGYTIYENGSAIATTANTSYTVTNLAGATTYHFTVAASDSSGVGTQSSSLAVTTSTASICTGVAAWNGNFVYYAVGALVTYDGKEFKCIQAHTSEPNWDPETVPALWSLVGPC
jgi:chitodextrinase